MLNKSRWSIGRELSAGNVASEKSLPSSISFECGVIDWFETWTDKTLGMQMSLQLAWELASHSVKQQPAMHHYNWLIKCRLFLHWHMQMSHL